MSRQRASWVLVLALLIYVAYLVAQFLVPTEQETRPQDVQEGWYSLYFTNPQGASAYTLRDGPDAMLAAAIDEADRSIEVAVLELNLWSIRDALLRAHNRGLDVRIVIESDYAIGPEIQALTAAGISVRGDERRPLMHHKFVILDDSEVWTGSMNLTVNGAYRNNNNLLRIESPWVAARYSEEFDEMFVEDRFGPLSIPDLIPQTSAVGGTQLEVLFAPDASIGDRITDLIEDAEHSIHVMAFNLTLDSIADAMLQRAQAGIEFQGLFDEGQAHNQGSDVDRLDEAGLDVGLDGNPRKMHHKVIIIDGEIVITGSYNFSRSADESNDENVLLIYSREIAEQFLLEFFRLREEASY